MYSVCVASAQGPMRWLRMSAMQSVSAYMQIARAMLGSSWRASVARCLNASEAKESRGAGARGGQLVGGDAEVAGRALVSCVGSGVISRAFAESWRPFAAYGVRDGESGEGVGLRSAVECVLPEGERISALSGHGENTSGGSMGSVASRVSRESESARGVGRMHDGGGFKYNVENYVVRLGARGRVGGDGAVSAAAEAGASRSACWRAQSASRASASGESESGRGASATG